MKIEIKTWQRLEPCLRGKKLFSVVGENVDPDDAWQYYREAARHHGPSAKIIEIICDGNKVANGWIEHGKIYLQACKDQIELAHKIASAMSFEKAVRLDEYKTAFLYFCGQKLVLA